MRLLYVAPDIALDPAHPTGGATRVREVAHHLAALGHSVWVIARRSGGDPPEEGELEPGVRVVRLYRGILVPLAFEREAVGRAAAGPLRTGAIRLYLRGPYMLWVLLHSLRLIRKHRIEAVIERAHAYGAGIWAAHLLRLPAVVEMVDADASPRALRRAGSILAHSREMAGGDLAERVRVYAMGANPDLFRPRGKREETRRSLGLRGTVVVYVGTLKPWHGIEDAIEAMAGLPEAALLVVGGAPEDVERLKGAAERRGLGSRVLFAGAVPYPQVPDYLEAADIAVAPVRREMALRFGHVCPIKVFEYMAAGKPIVATRVGQIPEVLEEGRRGLLVEPEDPPALAAAVRRLIDDPVLARSLGERAREAAHLHSWEGVARNIHECLLEAAKEKRR